VEDENARREILMLFEMYKKAAIEHDVEGHSALYSNDLFWAAPNRPVARTKKEMQAIVTESFNTTDFDFKLEVEEIKVFDEHAYLLLGGLVTICPKSTRDTVRYEPATLMILKKGEEGWKILRQVHNFRRIVQG
jgi:ketosteroid isomerase-like protein